jgi:hypothetical protein
MQWGRGSASIGRPDAQKCDVGLLPGYETCPEQKVFKQDGLKKHMKDHLFANVMFDPCQELRGDPIHPMSAALHRISDGFIRAATSLLEHISTHQGRQERSGPETGPATTGYQC